MMSPNNYKDLKIDKEEDNISYFSDTLSNNIKNLKIEVDINEKDIEPNQFEINNINFGNIKSNTYGFKIIPIKYNNDDLEIVTSVLRMPFGISTTDKDNSYYLSLSFDNKNNNLYELIKKIEEHCIDYIYNNQEMLKNGKINKKSKELIQELFKTKIDQKDNFPPYLRINLKTNNEYINTKVKIINKIDEEKIINIDELDLNTTKGCNAKCTILIKGISILGTGYSLSLFVKDISIYNRKTSKTRIIF
jgi:hypothetical protein